MNNKNSASSLLVYFFVSFFVLTFSGFIFKSIFVVYNYSQIRIPSFSEIIYALVWGLRFDFASAAILTFVSCVVLLVSYRIKVSTNPALVLLVVMFVTQMCFQIGDSIYYADAGRHVSYEMRDVVVDAQGLLLTAIRHQAPFILCSAVIGFMLLMPSIYFTRRIMSRQWIEKRTAWAINLQYEAIFLLVLAMTVVLVRGGVTGLPQSVISAFKIGDAEQAVVAMNGSYSVVYGILNSSKEVKRLSINLPEDISAGDILKELYPVTPVPYVGAGEMRYNLVIIFLESWPAELMASYGYDQTTTPFFDSLLKKSYAPKGVIAGGLRTTEGIYATMCSQQNPLGETVAQSSLQNYSYHCLPEILKRKGWSTAFFQGTHKETSGTGAFAQSLGFVESYAIEDMPAGRYTQNYWGAHDPDIYDFALEQIDAMQQPFMVGINTNSTHDSRLPENVLPFFESDESRGNKRNILYFSDQAMRDFLGKFKNRPYYKNTVFVFLSDHTAGRNSSNFSRYLLPGTIYSENLIKAARFDQFVSQRDIAPTILDIFNISPAASFSGKSFYFPNENVPAGDTFFADYYDAGKIGWVSGSTIVETNISQPDQIDCYLNDGKSFKIVDKECDALDTRLSRQSLAFTAYSQERLFNGETRQFYKYFSQ